MPKLLYLLRTADYTDNPLLTTFDNTLRLGLSSILNVDLSDIQWLQACLLVRHGGLTIRSAAMLASSAFLASKRKCGRLPQQLRLQLDAVAVIPCLVQCLKPAALCLWEKNNTLV